MSFPGDERFQERKRFLCFFGGNLPEVARRTGLLEKPQEQLPPTSWEATDLLSRFPGDRLVVFASNHFCALRRFPIRHPCKASLAPCSSTMVHGADINAAAPLQRGYGATAARLTPDQKVGSSNLSGLILPRDSIKCVKDFPFSIGWGGEYEMDTLGIEPRASRMLSGCDTTTPRARCSLYTSVR